MKKFLGGVFTVVVLVIVVSALTHLINDNPGGIYQWFHDIANALKTLFVGATHGASDSLLHGS